MGMACSARSSGAPSTYDELRDHHPEFRRCGLRLSCEVVCRPSPPQAVTDREVWIKAGAIVAEHGAMTNDYIIEQLGNILDSHAEIEDWRRVAAAVDAIREAKPQ
jgi:hypothetical protein